MTTLVKPVSSMVLDYPVNILRWILIIIHLLPLNKVSCSTIQILDIYLPIAHKALDVLQYNFLQEMHLEKWYLEKIMKQILSYWALYAMMFSTFVTLQNEPVSCLISVRKMMWILFSGRKYRNLTVWLDEKEVEVIYPRSKKSNLTGLRIDALLAMRQWIRQFYCNFN